MEKSFQEFFKILKPGGFVLLSDYSTHSLATESLRKIEFNSPNSTADYESKRSGLEFKTNKDILEHKRSEFELCYFATKVDFQVKCINIATRNNFLINLLQWVFFRLIRKNLVSNLLDFRFKNTGYDLAGNHIDKQYDRSLPPYVFSSKIKLPFEKFKFLSKASIRFDNKLFIFRKSEPAEKIKSIKENKTLYVAALGVSNS